MIKCNQNETWSWWASAKWTESHTHTHTHTHTHEHMHMHELRKAKKCKRMTSLVAWWSKIHLPMQKTQVWSLSHWDPTGHEAAKSACHTLHLSSRARKLQLLTPEGPRARAPKQEKPPQWEVHALQLESSFCSPQLEKAHVQQWRPITAPQNK